MWRNRRIHLAVWLVLAILSAACAGGGDAGSSLDTDSSSETVPEDSSTTLVPDDTVPSDVVTVAALGTIDSSPVWIAESERLFEEQGIEVEFVAVSEADEVVEALLQGRADAIAIAPTPIIKAVAAGEDLRIVNYLNATSPESTRHSMTLITTAEAEVVDGCDLAGLRVGVDNADSLVALAISEMILNAECDAGAETDGFVEEPTEEGDDVEDTAADADESPEETQPEEPTEAELEARAAAALARLESAEFVEASLGDQLDLLERGDVDVVGVFEPYTTQASALGFVEVANLDQELCPGLNRCPVGVIAMRDEWVDNNADVASRFNIAINKAMLWMESRQTEYRAELVACCGIGAEDAAGIRIPDWIGDVGALETDLPRLVDVLDRQGRLSAAPSIDEVIG